LALPLRIIIQITQLEFLGRRVVNFLPRISVSLGFLLFSPKPLALPEGIDVFLFFVVTVIVMST